MRVALVVLARQPAVWLGLRAAASCSLLDETFVAFGTLWLRASGVDPVDQGAAVPVWPRCTPRGYDQARPGPIAALTTVYGPLDLVLPLLLGVVADRFGLAAALLLLAQPLGILAVLRCEREKRPSAPP